MNEELLSEIGGRIQILREEQNITQQELADALGIRRPVIGKWEVGLQDLKTENIVAIANYFGVSCDYLLGVSKYKSAINEIIAQDMKLSDEAIEFLKDPFNLEMVDAILCSDEDLLTSLLRSIFMFFKPEETFNALLPPKLYSDSSGNTTKEFVEYLIDSFPNMLLEDIKSTVVDILMVMKDDYSIMYALDNIDVFYEKGNDVENQETVSDNEE